MGKVELRGKEVFPLRNCTQDVKQDIVIRATHRWNGVEREGRESECSGSEHTL